MARVWTSLLCPERGLAYRLPATLEQWLDAENLHVKALGAIHVIHVMDVAGGSWPSWYRLRSAWFDGFRPIAIRTGRAGQLVPGLPSG